MEKIAIIDLGSNSARLVLVNILEGGFFAVFDELKESVRLAQDMQDGFLKPVRIAQTIKTLKLFRRLCDANGIDRIYAYATAAVRKAKNQRGFLDEVAATCGFKLKVLDSDEEAQLVYQGVINSMDIPKGLIMDIGGGSINLIYYNRKNLLGHTTIPYGAVTLTEMFKEEELRPEERVKKIEEFILSELDKIEWMKQIDPEIRLIGVGGSFRNLGKISRMTRKYPLDMAHNYVIGKDDFISLYNHIKVLDLDKTMKIKGLSSVRADIFPSALACINAIEKYLGLEEIVISGSGLREGAMFKYAVPSTNEKPLTDILGHSIYTILHNFDENILHAEHVYNLSIQLFKQLKVLHKLPRMYVKVLRTAAMLHDTGNRIKYYDHHKHSCYMILNSNLYGISHKDLIMAGFVASLHRKGSFDQSELLKYRDILTDDDKDAIMKLGVILRIAESFDRSMSGVIKNITCDVLGDRVIMKTEADGDCSLEIKDALTCSNDFKRSYRKNLQIL
ncbi:MAG: Ppx/GppA family phosphatase [Clostridia bacterium]|jgi:exopolyphosphatase/guanosine-5'-triphosphate,3'-diphosphate pyrophosphatase|nr:Ppx/GppA family phosphatase [Clostridia bacterium]